MFLAGFSSCSLTMWIAQPEPLPRVSEAVALRRLRRSDLEDFQTYRTDRELGRYQGWLPQSDADAQSFIDAMSAAPLFVPGTWVQLAICEPGSSRLVGDIGLFVGASAAYAEIGFTLSRPAQGRGLATAAVREAVRLLFERTPVEAVHAVCDRRNEPSLRVIERVGMRLMQTRATEFRGEPCVELTFAITRGDR